MACLYLGRITLGKNYVVGHCYTGDVSTCGDLGDNAMYSVVIKPSPPDTARRHVKRSSSSRSLWTGIFLGMPICVGKTLLDHGGKCR